MVSNQRCISSPRLSREVYLSVFARRHGDVMYMICIIIGAMVSSSGYVVVGFRLCRYVQEPTTITGFSKRFH